MRILEVSRYKNNFADHQLPFVTEQGEAIRTLGHEVDYFLVKGNYIKAVGALKRKIHEFKPDIVHAHFGLSAITAELQSLVPVVTTFHNGETLNWHVNLMSSLMSLRAKHVIYVAQHIRDLSYFKARQYSIIPCGVPMEQMTIVPQSEARRQLGWDPNKKYILFGGAFSNTRKNYALLRDAIAKINEQSPITNHQSPIECVEMKNLTRSECVLRMNACDLFALPSHSEGSPQALKEAMAVNCPCLATDIADVRELFGDEPGHWILRNPRKTHERWDADEKSLDEMVQLLNDALKFEGRTNGRQRILDLELSNEQVAKRIINIYKEILA
jgi:glycosyltransferase involved in cell wall biosynthesis